jgi:hypothetical protein
MKGAKRSEIQPTLCAFALWVNTHKSLNPQTSLRDVGKIHDWIATYKRPDGTSGGISDCFSTHKRPYGTSGEIHDWIATGQTKVYP